MTDINILGLTMDLAGIVFLGGIFYRMGRFTSELNHVKLTIDKLERIIDDF